jgi:hypothetical protein
LGLQFCAPHVRVNWFDDRFDYINQFAWHYLNTFSDIRAEWLRWGETNQDCKRKPVIRIFMFPAAELSAPFYRNHIDYHSNSSIFADDCTHSCWAPNLYEPYWDFMAMVFNQTLCTEFDTMFPVLRPMPSITEKQGWGKTVKVESKSVDDPIADRDWLYPVLMENLRKASADFVPPK